MNTVILDNLMAQMDPKGLPAFSPAAKAQVRYLSVLRAVDPKGLGTFSPAAKIIVATSVCIGGRNSPPDCCILSSSPFFSVSPKERGHPVDVLFLLVDPKGLEPSTSRMRTERSPS